MSSLPTTLLAATFTALSLNAQVIDAFTLKPAPNTTANRISDPSGMLFGNPIEISGTPGPVQNCDATIITNCRTTRVYTTGYGSVPYPQPNYMSTSIGGMGRFSLYSHGASIDQATIEYNFTSLIYVPTTKKLHIDLGSALGNSPGAGPITSLCITASFTTRGQGARGWTMTQCLSPIPTTGFGIPNFYGFDLPVTSFLTPNFSGGYHGIVYLSALKLASTSKAPSQSLTARDFRIID